MVVVGGGDSAFEESLFLTKFASKVTLMYRKGKDDLRAGVQLQKRVNENIKINTIYHTVVESIIDDNNSGKVSKVKIKSVQSGETHEFTTDGIFIFIGHIPNSYLFNEQIKTDSDGYLITDQRFQTSIEGVFAAGEIQDPIWRQVATSVGQATAAAMASIHWLDEN